jgi:hypothetical protein
LLLLTGHDDSSKKQPVDDTPAKAAAAEAESELAAGEAAQQSHLHLSPHDGSQGLQGLLGSCLGLDASTEHAWYCNQECPLRQSES